MNTAANTPDERTTILNIIEQESVSIAEFVNTRRFTLAICDDVKAALKPLLNESGRTLILDLHDIEFIDSSGIGCVIALFKTAKGTGSSLRLCGLTPGVRDIFHLLHLQTIFDITGTRESCLQKL